MEPSTSAANALLIHNNIVIMYFIHFIILYMVDSQPCMVYAVKVCNISLRAGAHAHRGNDYFTISWMKMQR